MQFEIVNYFLVKRKLKPAKDDTGNENANKCADKDGNQKATKVFFKEIDLFRG